MILTFVTFEKFVLTYVNINGTARSVMYVHEKPYYARQSVTDALDVPSQLVGQNIDYASVFLTGHGNVSVAINSQLTLQTTWQVEFAPFFDLARGTTVQQSTIQLTLTGGNGNNAAAIASFADTLTLRATNVTLTLGQSNLSELFGVAPRVETSVTVISGVFMINTPANPISTQLAGLTAETTTLSVKGTTLTIGSMKSPKAMGLCLQATDINVVNATITAVLNQQYNAATHVSGLFSTVGALAIKDSTVTLTVNASEQYGGLGNTVSTSASITGSTLTITLSVGQKCVHVGALFNNTENAGTTLTDNIYTFTGYYTRNCAVTGECESSVQALTEVIIQQSSFTSSQSYNKGNQSREFKHVFKYDQNNPTANNVNNSKFIYQGDMASLENKSFSPVDRRPIYSNILITSQGQISINSGNDYPFYGTLAPFLTTETCIISVSDTTNIRFSASHVGGVVAMIANSQEQPIKIVNCTMTNTLNGKEMSPLTHQLVNNSHVTIQNCTCGSAVTATSHTALIVRTKAGVSLTITNLSFTGSLIGTQTGNVAIIGDISGSGTVSLTKFVLSGTIKQERAVTSGITNNIAAGATLNLQHGEIRGTINSTSGVVAGVASTVQQRNNNNIVVDNVTVDSDIRSTSEKASALFGVVNNNMILQLTNITIRNSISSQSQTVGGVAGSVQQSVQITINSLTMDATVTSNSNMAGGVAPQLNNNTNITISGGSITARVQGGVNSITGGIIGGLQERNHMRVSNINVNISVLRGGSRIGGMLGLLYSQSLTLSNVTGSTRVTAGGDSIGGVLGIMLIAGTLSIDNITLETSVETTRGKGGGLVGEIHTTNAFTITISNAQVTSSVTRNSHTDGSIVGGIIGSTSSNTFRINHCSFTVSLYGGQDQGGLIGWHRENPTLEMSNVTLRFIGRGPEQNRNKIGAVIGYSQQKPRGTQSNVTAIYNGVCGRCPNGPITQSANQLTIATQQGGTGVFCQQQT